MDGACWIFRRMTVYVWVSEHVCERAPEEHTTHWRVAGWEFFFLFFFFFVFFFFFFMFFFSLLFFGWYFSILQPTKVTPEEAPKRPLCGDSTERVNRTTNHTSWTRQRVSQAVSWGRRTQWDTQWENTERTKRMQKRHSTYTLTSFSIFFFFFFCSFSSFFLLFEVVLHSNPQIYKGVEKKRITKSEEGTNKHITPGKPQPAPVQELSGVARKQKKSTST